MMAVDKKWMGHLIYHSIILNFALWFSVSVAATLYIS